MDRAGAYLNALQLGYRTEEYFHSASGIAGKFLFLPFNGNRVLVEMSTSGGSDTNFYHRLDSGQFLPIGVSSLKETFVLTVALHYSLPTREIYVDDGGIGTEFYAIALIKL